jgi:glutathione peroxidase
MFAFGRRLIARETIMANVHEIAVKTIAGEESSLGAYRGKAVLAVNVASACGLTPQYEGLEKLYQNYRDKGLVVAGFPANNFGAQEPGTNEEIRDFCATKFDVSFPMFAKISVRGEDQHPLYAQMIAEAPRATPSPGGGLKEKLAAHGLAPKTDSEVMWNFEKFLIGKDGKVVGRFHPDVPPDSPALLAAIEQALAG